MTNPETETEPQRERARAERGKLERIIQTASREHSPGSVVAAVAHLAPRDVIDWLAREEEAARTLSTGELATLLRAAARADPAGVGANTGRCLLELARKYADRLDGDTTVAIFTALADNDLSDGQDILRGALDREPNHAGLLRLAAVHARDAGEGEQAHDLLTRLALADDSQGNQQYVWRQREGLAPSSGEPVRVALMSSFTVDPLAHYVDRECRALGLEPSIHLTPFNSWTQAVLDDGSALREFRPEIAFLSVAIDDLIPELADGPPTSDLVEPGETAVDRVLSVARRFVQWSEGVLVVHSFHSAYPDPLGVAAGRSAERRSNWLADLNERLLEGLSELPRSYMLDTTDVLLRREGGVLDNVKMRHMAAMRLTGPALSQLARAYACYIGPVKGLTRKCVVVDLDNTLWGGIVGEDGPHGIKLGNTAPGVEYQEFQRYLSSLTRHGFLLAVNSKNNPEDALAVIRSHEDMVLREDAFSAMRINWQPKPENMLSIAHELDIGVDSLLFIDDNPHERELMRQSLPEVLTPELPSDPSRYRATLENLPQLQKLVITDADRTRTEQYRAKRQRQEARVSAMSLEGYLSSLNINVTITGADEATLPRIHQLFERTNQFNLTTRRYTAGELADLAGDPACHLYVLRARDRFGDHGLVATALVRSGAERWVIDSFLMSCRVIGYGVESALLARILAEAEEADVEAVVGEFIETAKNAPARDFYQRHGFSETGPAGDASRWVLKLAEGKVTTCPDWIQMESPHGT